MTKQSWRTVAEIFGLAALVASLIFVGIQLQQDRAFARSELGSQSFEYFNRIDAMIHAADFAPIYLKMIQSPNELTNEEMIRINAFYRTVAGLMSRECYLTQTGVFPECERAIGDIIRNYFGNAYAKAWWKKTNSKHVIELPVWVDQSIANATIEGSDGIETIQADAHEYQLPPNQ